MGGDIDCCRRRHCVVVGVGAVSTGGGGCCCCCCYAGAVVVNWTRGVFADVPICRLTDFLFIVSVVVVRVHMRV